MWDELTRALSRFPHAVITAKDTAGHPASARCHPRPDHAERILRLDPLPGFDLAAGPASLLCHSHDPRLWALRSFLARGTVTPDADGPDGGAAGWVFTPSRVVLGTGMAGPVADLRGFLAARRRAARYLARRGLTRPAIPWARLRSSQPG
jgi:hypothetical protein